MSGEQARRRSSRHPPRAARGLRGRQGALRRDQNLARLRRRRDVKGRDGKVEIVKKHEEPTRYGAAHGLGWGLATGAVAALFQPPGSSAR